MSPALSYVGRVHAQNAEQVRAWRARRAPDVQTCEYSSVQPHSLYVREYRARLQRQGYDYRGVREQRSRRARFARGIRLLELAWASAMMYPHRVGSW